MKYTTIAILLLLFTSCKITEYYSYESIKAPEIILPADAKTIGFLNRNNHFDSDTIYQYFLYNGKIQKDTNVYDSIKIANCYAGFKDNVDNSVTEQAIPLIQLPRKNLSGKRQNTPLSWDITNDICAKKGIDVLVCLEDMQIFNQYETFSEETENGDDIYVGNTLIKYSVTWRIYDPLLKKYYHEQIITDSLYTTNEAYSKKALFKEMPHRKSIFTDIAYEIGTNYAKKISPEWQNTHRYYFVAGNRDFSVADYYFKDNELDKAMTVWQQIATQKDKKLAARAAYNLALAYEIKEDYKQAFHWLRQSIAFYRKLKKEPSEISIVKDYHKKLTEKAKNHNRLNLFFGK